MENLSVSKESENFGYKFKMNFALRVHQQIRKFSKNKNKIRYMQKPNRTLLKNIITIFFLRNIQRIAGGGGVQ